LLGADLAAPEDRPVLRPSRQPSAWRRCARARRSGLLLLRRSFSLYARGRRSRDHPVRRLGRGIAAARTLCADGSIVAPVIEHDCFGCWSATPRRSRFGVSSSTAKFRPDRSSRHLQSGVRAAERLALQCVEPERAGVGELYSQLRESSPGWPSGRSWPARRDPARRATAGYRFQPTSRRRYLKS